MKPIETLEEKEQYIDSYFTSFNKAINDNLDTPIKVVSKSFIKEDVPRTKLLAFMWHNLID